MCYCVDLRGDSKLAKLLSYKIIAFLVAATQLVIWVAILFALIAPPEAATAKLQSAPAGELAFAVILFLAGTGFSVLLLLGIFKNNRIFIQVFLVFNLVMTVLLIVGIITSIFTKPTEIGLSGFLSFTFFMLFNFLTCFIIRNYYLGLTSRPTGQTQNPYPGRMGV